MREFTFERQTFGSCLVYRLMPGEELDRMALGMLRYNEIPGLLPVSCLYEDGKQTVRFQLSSLTALPGYWAGQIGRRKLLAFLSSFCRAVLECQEYLLDPSNLLLDWDYIFVEPLSGTVRLAYLPVEGDGGDRSDARAFLEGLIRRTSFDPAEDGSHIAVILNTLRSENFSVDQLDARLKSLAQPQEKAVSQQRAETGGSAQPSPPPARPWTPPAEPAVPPVQPQPIPQVPPAQPQPIQQPAQKESKKGGFSLLGGNKAPKLAKPSKKKDAAQEFDFAVPGMTVPAERPAAPTPAPQPAPAPQKVKHGILGGFGKKKELIAPAGPQTEQSPPVSPIPPAAPPVPPAAPPAPQPHPAPSGGGGYTVPLGGGSAPKNTVPFGQGQDTAQGVSQLILSRRRNGQRLPINKPVFHVGREQSIVDFLIGGGNQWIGKDHAYFVRKEDGYYLVDNNSMNHTWLNGELLVSNQPYAVKAGDVIKMADEEFDLLPG